MNTLDIFKKPASGSAALKARLEELEATRPEIEREIERLTRDRAAMLLDSDDAKIRKVEQELADRRRDRDRVNAANEELSRRIEIAVTDEAAKALTRLRDEVDGRAREIAARLRSDYAKHATAIAKLANDLIEAESEVLDLNAKLIAANRAGEVLPPVESRAWPPLPVEIPEAFSVTRADLPPAPSFPGFGRFIRALDLQGVHYPAAAE